MKSNGKHACDRYDQAEGELKSFTRSAVRTKVMLCLMDRDMDAGELAEEMSLRTSTILHSMKEMIESHLVMRTDHGYALTNIGRIQALLLNELTSTIIALDQQHDFWLTHDLSGVPVDLQMKIGMLAQSKRIVADVASPLKSLENFMAEVSRAKEIYGFSPINITGFHELIADGVSRGAKVELIITDSILKIVSQENPEGTNSLRNYKNFHLYHIDIDAKVAFTVTESMIALGLYRINEGIDLASELICEGPEATKWGRMLFEYYRSRAEPMWDN